MTGLTLEGAKPLVREMFAAHGAVPLEAVVQQYASVMVEAACSACAIETVEQIRKHHTGQRLPNGPGIRFRISERLNEPSHALHGELGYDYRAEGASRTEAFWRHDGANTIVRETGWGSLEALLVAAEMWASESVPADAGQVADECRPKAGREVWGAVIARHREVTHGLVQEAFAKARRIATVGHQTWWAETHDEGRLPI